jgi:hypothetical protein
MKTGNGMHCAAEPLEPSRSATCIEAGASTIANLPPQIRDELNYRINDGDQGIELVEWLNSKPEVAEVVNKLFDGTPITEQNLSEWRKRGYQKWLAHRNFVDESNALSDNTGDIAATGIDCDKLLLTLTAAYAEAIQNWIITPGEQMLYKLAVYKNLTNGVIALQRAELQKVRLEIARERLELLREKRRNKSAACSTLSAETVSSPDAAPASHPSGSGSRSRPATADGATPAASLSLSTSEDSMRAADPTGAEERREPPGVSLAEDLPVASSPDGSAAFDDSSSCSPDGNLRAPSAAAAKESAPVIPEPDGTPEPGPAIPAPLPAIDYEFWRGLRSPSFVGVPRGGPSHLKPATALPETGPTPAPQPKPSAPPAVNPGAARPSPSLTRPSVPNQVRPKNPDKTITAIRPVPPLVKHNTTIRVAR